VLGLCTRNVGAAAAPLLSVPGSDRRALVMCIVAVFVTFVIGFAAAHLLGRLDPARKPIAGSG